MELVGVVAPGFGMATSSLAPMMPALREKSRLALVEGTLNVTLDEPYVVVPDFVLEASTYDHHETLLLQFCKVEAYPGVILRTSTQAQGDSHPLNVIEVLSTVGLREALLLRGR